MNAKDLAYQMLAAARAGDPSGETTLMPDEVDVIASPAAQVDDAPSDAALEALAAAGRWIWARTDECGRLRPAAAECRTLLASEAGRRLADELADWIDLSALYLEPDTPGATLAEAWRVASEAAAFRATASAKAAAAAVEAQSLAGGLLAYAVEAARAADYGTEEDRARARDHEDDAFAAALRADWARDRAIALASADAAFLAALRGVEMKPNLAVILGASDPEMTEIEAVARAMGAAVYYATHRGVRATPANAYAPDGIVGPNGETIIAPIGGFGQIVVVECAPAAGCASWPWLALGLVPGAEAELDCAALVTRVDHHAPGDPGFGRPPSEYLEASSLGQVLALLGLAPTPRQRLIAAADHCLGAAYRGECPGVDPEELMVWRAESRAAFQGRSVDEVLADVEATTAALRAALQVDLRSPAWATHDYAHDWARSVCKRCARDSVWVADMRRDPPWPELPEAATRLGAGYISGPLKGPDGRQKYTCSGSPEQVRAWMEVAEDAFGLTDLYGDPARGFAGGYQARASTTSPAPPGPPGPSPRVRGIQRAPAAWGKPARIGERRRQ